MSSKNPVGSKEGVSNTSTASLEYEVFLSFRGSDTRKGFTSHLYMTLNERGIRVFIDDKKLRTGEEIGPEILKGINESRIAIPIFSKHYAESKWCLKELTQIVECKRTNGLKVMPIFYDVTPAEVRNQTEEYGEAFESHEKHYDKETIASWKRALKEVGYLKGWDLQSGTNRNEGELVREVIRIVSRELKKGYLVVTNCLVGLEQHVEEISKMSSTKIDGVFIVGIYGLGGIGKTTLGKVIYNDLLPCFENHCFLADIREMVRSKGKEFLQKKLISDILNGEPINISHVDEGIKIISERFSRKKVLLLLDDVDEVIQLQVLIRERAWFGFGSKIIITTRNKHILDQIKVDQSYELNGLDNDQALQLFSHHAFRSGKPLDNYATLSRKVVERAGGLPLALEVFGSLLCGKSKDAWDYTLEKIERDSYKEIGRKLKISFDALDDRQKQIFLDIACFFIGEDKRITVHFWDELEFPEDAIEVLQEMCLIEIQDDHSIRMHDLLRDLGREIVRQEHVNLGKQSRLWSKEEAAKLFMRKMGSDDVQGISLDFYGQEILDFYGETEYSISNENFASLPNLKLLWVKSSYDQYQCQWYKKFMADNFSHKSAPMLSQLRWLSWHMFPDVLNVSNFSLEDLVILDLSQSNIKSTWSGWRRVKMAKNLKVLNLTGCDSLVRTPDFSSHPKLEQIILEGCHKLEEIDESISMLEHLVVINLRYCKRLQKLPKKLSCTESLKELIISETHIVEIPNWPHVTRLKVFESDNCRYLKTVGPLDFAANITELRMDFSCITVLPDSIRNMVNLQKLSLKHCNGIKTLPESITDLESLIDLDLTSSGIVELPHTIGKLKNLKVFKALGTPLRELPTAIGLLENLITLEASYGEFSHDIPNLPQSSMSLKEIIPLEEMSDELPRIPDLSGLINLKDLALRTPYGGDCPLGADNPNPWWIGRLTNLERLTLGFGHIISLHADLGALCQLTILNITCCDQLQSIPKLPSGLKDLSILTCGSLGSLADLPSGLTSLQICYCKSLAILDLSHLRKLCSLRIVETPICKLKEISSCESLQELDIENVDFFEIDGLEMLESVTTLEIRKCEKLQRLPNLSSLKKLRELKVLSCPDLVEILGRLESLNDFHIEDCASLERIPDIPNSKTMGGRFRISNCEKLDKYLQQQSADTQLQ